MPAMINHSATLLALLTLGATLPALGAMKMGDFTESGALVVADSFNSGVIHKSNFSTDDLQRMSRQLEEQQRTLQEQARQIDTLQRQLEEQRRTLDDLKRSR